MAESAPPDAEGPRVGFAYKTPYIPHLFGEDVGNKLALRSGWLTVGIAASIPWPKEDVWILYDGSEYVLRGAKEDGQRSRTPCINTPCPSSQGTDEALSRLYRFVSILGYFKRGYVDIAGVIWSTRATFYAGVGPLVGMVLDGARHFNCNYLPIVEDEQIRKALAFLREGRRLRNVHAAYSFLSFFKVIESQFGSNDRVEWIDRNLDRLEGQAARRVTELRGQGINVNQHLYDSGRCAVAHASLLGTIVDPDNPADRKRISADLDVIEELATRFVRVDAQVPDEMDLYRSRDRLEPWYSLMTPKAVAALKAAEGVQDVADLGKLQDSKVAVSLWPDPPPAQFKEMTLLPVESRGGKLKLIALNERQTILLSFLMDVPAGHMHSVLKESGMRDGEGITEEDVEDFTRYFHSVIANGHIELRIDGVEPVACEVVIPVNIIPQAPEKAVGEALKRFRQAKAQMSESSAPGPTE